MAPEQIVGGPVDARTDLYAVGAILYELLTGRPPFTGRTDAEVMTHVMLRPPKPLRAYVRTLPAALETVLRSCLSKEPASRPATAEALAKELRVFMAPPAKTAPQPVRRPRKTSEPLPLVKKSAGAPGKVASLCDIDVDEGSEVEPAVTIEAALPLVTRAGSASPDGAKKAVLELVGDEEP
jgi:serine/threonine protein kinase